MTTPTEDARRRVRTQLDLQLADDHEFVMIERCDAEALIEPIADDDREAMAAARSVQAYLAMLEHNDPDHSETIDDGYGPDGKTVSLEVADLRVLAAGFRRQVSQPEPVTDVYAVQKEVLDWMEAHDGVNGDTYRLYRMGRAHYAALEAARAVRLPVPEEGS